MSADRRAEQELIEQIVNGDRQAWTRLVTQHRDDVRYALLRTCARRGARLSPQALEDLEAELMLALATDDFRRLRGYRGQSSLRQWLKVVASNAAIDHLRRQRKQVPIATSDEPEDGAAVVLTDPRPGPQAHVERREQVEAARRLIAQLGDEDQLFIELYYRRELPFTRVAQLMATSVNALYARKNRLRKRLQTLAREAALL